MREKQQTAIEIETTKLNTKETHKTPFTQIRSDQILLLFEDGEHNIAIQVYNMHKYKLSPRFQFDPFSMGWDL